MIQVAIKRIDKELPLPQYETQGSVGFDLLARTDTTIQPKAIALIPGNVIVATPQGYMLAIVSRSSSPRKKGLTMPHAIGVIDQDYCGPEDEVLIQVMNFTDAPVTVKRGEKIAQGIFMRVDRIAWQEVERVEAPTRGGFGESGGYSDPA